MIDSIRFLIREPALAGIVFVCVALVGGLILSGWAEKRRTRELLRAKEAARLAMHRQNSAAPASVPAPVPNPLFRIFRWRFVVLAILVLAFVYPSVDEETKVKAKEPQASETSPVQTAKNAEPATVAPAVSASKPNSASGGGSLNPDALFQFDTRSDLGDTERNVLAPKPSQGELPFPSRSAFSHR